MSPTTPGRHAAPTSSSPGRLSPAARSRTQPWHLTDIGKRLSHAATTDTCAPATDDWVHNGDSWTITNMSEDGFRKIGNRLGSSGVQPAKYPAEHVDLGCALTAHRAQGITVVTARTLIKPTSTWEHVYVAMPRASESNHAEVSHDQPDEKHDGSHGADSAEAPGRSSRTGRCSTRTPESRRSTRSQ